VAQPTERKANSSTDSVARLIPDHPDHCADPGEHPGDAVGSNPADQTSVPEGGGRRRPRPRGRDPWKPFAAPSAALVSLAIGCSAERGGVSYASASRCSIARPQRRYSIPRSVRRRHCARSLGGLLGRWRGRLVMHNRADHRLCMYGRRLRLSALSIKRHVQRMRMYRRRFER
jgi:hypothetical protein